MTYLIANIAIKVAEYAIIYVKAGRNTNIKFFLLSKWDQLVFWSVIDENHEGIKFPASN